LEVEPSRNNDSHLKFTSGFSPLARRVTNAERTVMENQQQLLQFINHIVSDQRLKRRHLAMLIALCDVWIANKCQASYHMSRSRLMIAAKIKAQGTYQKVIKELQALGYVAYKPSYHPKEGSTITWREEFKAGIDHESANIQ
jgi:hypothetical protein